jgi:hypothetical protein
MKMLVIKLKPAGSSDAKLLLSCDPRVPQKLKGKLYRTAIRPTIMYGAEC